MAEREKHVQKFRQAAPSVSPKEGGWVEASERATMSTEMVKW